MVRQCRAMCWGVLLWAVQHVAVCSCLCCGGQDRQGSVRLDKVVREVCTELVTSSIKVLYCCTALKCCT